MLTWVAIIDEDIVFNRYLAAEIQKHHGTQVIFRQLTKGTSLSWGCHGKFFLREDEFWGH